MWDKINYCLLISIDDDYYCMLMLHTQQKYEILTSKSDFCHRNKSDIHLNNSTFIISPNIDDINYSFSLAMKIRKKISINPYFKMLFLPSKCINIENLFGNVKLQLLVIIILNVIFSKLNYEKHKNYYA